MNKPFSIIVEETKQKLVDIINQSGLHPSIVEMIVKDIYWEVNRLSIETTTREKEYYLQEPASE